MPDATVEMDVAAPVADVWRFVTEFGNWAHLMPGYQGFEPVDGETSFWTLKSDVGIFQRVVRFQVRIAERDAPSRLAFELRAVDENLRGSGSLVAQPAGEQRTHVTFHLSMAMTGLLGPVGNALLDGMLPRDTEALARGVKQVIERQVSV